MRVVDLIALASIALGCFGPSPATGGDDTSRRAFAAQKASSPPGQTRFEEGLLRLHIRRSLLEHLQTSALGVEVEVVGSSAVLSGKVEERADRMLAEEVALTVSGVDRVLNEIEVENGSGGSGGALTRGARAMERELADATLELLVQTELVRELGEIAFHVEVEATDGVVSLRGPIPDERRQELAVARAQRVEGVREVHDLLQLPQ